MKTAAMEIQDDALTEELDPAQILDNKEQKSENSEHSTLLSQNKSFSFSDRYKTICHFSSGGMGDLYKSRDQLFNRIVAVKTLQHKFNDDPIAVSRFFEECLLNSRLDHPSIVPIYGFGRDKNGDWSVAMKYISGQTLRNFLNELRKTYQEKNVSQRQERMALLSRLEYFVRICDVVDYCHQSKIIHGDLKPENILLGAHGELYLLDWGCSKYSGTLLKSAIGTPAYLPPEFFEKPILTKQVDIYSLGVILFELVTMTRAGTVTLNSNGTGPRRIVSSADDGIECLDITDASIFKHISGNLRISYRIKGIIMKAVNPDPEQRYSSVHEMVTDVRRFMFGDPVSAAKEPVLSRICSWIANHKRFSTIAVLTILTALIAETIFFMYNDMTIIQEERSSRLTHLQIQAENSSLVSSLDKIYASIGGRMIHLAGNLEHLYSIQNNDPRQHCFTNEDFRSGKQVPSDFAEYPGFPGKVSLFQPVVLEKGPAFEKLISPALFAVLVRKADALRYFSIGKNSLTPLDCKYISCVFVQWADGTRYSWPGRVENEDSLAFKARWNVGFKDSILWSEPYYDSGELFFSRYISLQDITGKQIGILGLEIKISKVFEKLIEISAANPNREYHFVGIRNRVITFFRGKMIQQKNKYTPLGVHSETVIRVGTIVRHGSMFIGSSKNKEFIICGVPMNSSFGGVLIQIVPQKEMDAIENAHKRELTK